MKKHIYIYSPSSAVRDKSAFKRGLSRLIELGYDVEVDKDALATHMRFAGDDEMRLSSIQRAAGSGADIALISRGGYGLSRILPSIDYKAVAKAVSNGTKFVGFSDFTALQMALLAKTGAVSWAGPALGEDFGRAAGSDDIMEACFNDLVTGQGEGSGWRIPKVDVASTAITTDGIDAELSNHASKLENSILWGGNLSILVSLLGTPYLPAVKGGILFIEDVGEHPYRIERMLCQLLQAGVLAQQKAIIFGQFSNYQLTPHDKGYKLASVINWLRGLVKASVFTGLPFGHVATKVLLPVGLPVTLAVEGRDAFLLWSHHH